MTNREIRILRQYESWIEKPPGFADLLRRAAPRLLLLAAVGAAGAYLVSDQPVVAGFLAGLAAGAILRTITMLRLAAQGAPLLARIIDPDRLRALLEPPPAVEEENR